MVRLETGLFQGLEDRGGEVSVVFDEQNTFAMHHGPHGCHGWTSHAEPLRCRGTSTPSILTAVGPFTQAARRRALGTLGELHDCFTHRVPQCAHRSHYWSFMISNVRPVVRAAVLALGLLTLFSAHADEERQGSQWGLGLVTLYDRKPYRSFDNK